MRRSCSHTPKPWTRRQGFKRSNLYIDGGETLPGASGPRAIVQLCDRASYGEREANAALILAAPELLEGCVAALQVLDALASLGTDIGERAGTPKLREQLLEVITRAGGTVWPAKAGQ